MYSLIYTSVWAVETFVMLALYWKVCLLNVIKESFYSVQKTLCCYCLLSLLNLQNKSLFNSCVTKSLKSFLAEWGIIFQIAELYIVNALCRHYAMEIFSHCYYLQYGYARFLAQAELQHERLVNLMLFKVNHIRAFAFCKTFVLAHIIATLPHFALMRNTF